MVGILGADVGIFSVTIVDAEGVSEAKRKLRKYEEEERSAATRSEDVN